MLWTFLAENYTHAAFKPPLWPPKMKMADGVGISLVYFRFVRHFCRPTAVFVVAIIVALCGYLNVLFSLLFAFQFRLFFGFLPPFLAIFSWLPFFVAAWQTFPTHLLPISAVMPFFMVILLILLFRPPEITLNRGGDLMPLQIEKGLQIYKQVLQS